MSLGIFVRRLAGCASLAYLLIAHPTTAQIAGDGTVPTLVTSSDALIFTITGGREINGNLFHSFREFSVPTGGAAIFDHPANVQNVLNRVTGGSISSIDGLIQVNGNANFFLINPNGIVFGSNARLDVKGSFVASTADSIVFENPGSFSASEPRDSSLLNVTIPIGLRFGRDPGKIVNRAATVSFPADVPGLFRGLHVLPNRTLALVGGGISIVDSGAIVASGARLELGSVGGESFVRLIPVPSGWTIGYEGVSDFQDIEISGGSFVQASTGLFPVTSGDIRLQGRGIYITAGSGVVSLNNGSEPGGNITINAAGVVEVSGRSEITAGSLEDSTGAAGSIEIDAGRFLAREGSFIDSASDGSGRGGDLTVRARESIEITDAATVMTNATGSAIAGELRLITRRLLVTNGGQVSGNTRGAFDGGAVFVRADESVEVGGSFEFLDGTVQISELSARTTGGGDGGFLQIDTGRLIVRDGGNLSVAAIGGSTGRAGELTINAANSVEIAGRGSELFATSQSPEPAGTVTIDTPLLTLRDGATISASSVSSRGGDLNLRIANELQVDNGEISASTESGRGGNLSIETDRLYLSNGGTIGVSGTDGQAGNLRVRANSLFLNRGSITAETGRSATGGANIALNVADLLQMGEGSRIDATANQNANGGNITIDTGFLVAFPNGDSDITANAFGGRGGAIEISALGIFGTEVRQQLTPDNDITAFSLLQPTLDGTITLITPEIDPDRGAIEFPTTVVDPDRLIAQNPCKKGTRSELTLTGRGGIPTRPADDLDSAPVGGNLIEPVPTPAATRSPETSTTERGNKEAKTGNPVIPARGWTYNERGEVVLIASSPDSTESRSLSTFPASCPVP